MQDNIKLKTDITTEVQHIILESLEDSKAQSIVTLDVSHLTSITDVMMICNGTSNRHMTGIAQNAINAVKSSGVEVFNTEGLGNSDWMIVDCGDVILHVMSEASRAFYHLEGLWNIKSDTQ